MGRRKLNAVIGLVALGLLLACISSAWAAAVWGEGIVTKAPWKDTYDHLSVDGIEYTIAKNATFYRRFDDSDGISQQAPIRLQDVTKGQKILMRAQGFRIFQIIVVK